MRKVKVYVGCALTGAPVEFTEQVSVFKKQLQAEIPECEVMEFLGLIKGDERDVYRWDIRECVGKADFFIGFCDVAAIGLGYELATAIEKRGIPTVAVAHGDKKVTRLVKGIHDTKGPFRFQTYGDISEVIGMVKDDILAIHEILQIPQYVQEDLPLEIWQAPQDVQVVLDFDAPALAVAA
jgi:hypothetical protein